MIEVGGTIDLNDLKMISRKGLRAFAARPCPIGEGGKINPHVTRFLLHDGRLTDVFHIKPIYYEAQISNGKTEWRPMSEVAVHHGNRHIILHPSARERMTFRFRQWLMKRQAILGTKLQYGYGFGSPYFGAQPIDEFAAAQVIAYPDPDPETTTVDGTITVQDANWDTAHDATGGGTVSDNVVQMRAASEHNGSAYFIRRTFQLFDTSAIGSSGTITSADYDLYAGTKANDDNDGDDFMRIVLSNPASNTALAATDFDDCGAVDNPTAQASDVDITSISTGAYQTFAFNATGLSNISKTSISKFGCREGHDCVDSAVATSSSSYITWQSAEAANDPTLTVTYLGDATGVFLHGIETGSVGSMMGMSRIEQGGP